MALYYFAVKMRSHIERKQNLELQKRQDLGQCQLKEIEKRMENSQKLFDIELEIMSAKREHQKQMNKLEKERKEAEKDHALVELKMINLQYQKLQSLDSN